MQLNLHMIGHTKTLNLDFETNANGTFNLLQNFYKYCPKGVFINLSTNKVYGDNPNKLNLIEKKIDMNCLMIINIFMA